MITDKFKKYIIESFDKVKFNSKNIIEGDVFIALKGSNIHGSLFIKDALKNGAKYIIVEKKISNFKGAKIIVVDNVLKFLLVLAKEKRKKFKGKVIGITGSIGKTSLKECLKFFLEPTFNVSASIKSYNNFLGVILSLLNLDLNSDFGIFELGTNDFFEIRKLTFLVKPSQIIITNIYPTHLEKLINTQNIAEEKSDIFNPKYNKKIELAILPIGNKDETIILKKALNFKFFKIITFGKSIKSNVRLNKIKFFKDEYSELIIKCYEKKFSTIINNHQITKVNNILACLAIFLHNNIDLNILFLKSKNIPLIAGRGLKHIIQIKKFKLFFIDESYNASPHSMKSLIDNINNLQIKKNQKKILILGDMKELGKNTLKFHIDLLNYISKKNLYNIILCGEFMKIALQKNINNKFMLINSKKLILDYLEKNVRSNDIIFIKGSNSSLTNKLAIDLLKRKVA